MSGSGLAVFVPLLLAVGSVQLYLVAKILPTRMRRWTGTFTAAWLTAAFALLAVAAQLGLVPGDEPMALLRVSSLGLLLGLLVTGLGALAALASQGRIDPDGPVHLYYPLFLLALAGAVAVGFANDLFTLFVMVELSALPSYALVAYRYKEDPRALPAALKYLIQGVAGTVTALLGVSLLYLAGGTLVLSSLPAALAAADPTLVSLAAALLLVGYGVKLAAVPLHTWLPDAYVHAPAGVTAIMAGATKAGALVALLLSLSALPLAVGNTPYLGIAVNLLAVLTMTVGNLLALNQRDLRRVLAYSSVAQMGYLLLGFGIGLQWNLALGFEAALFYMVAYGVMKGGAFLSADLLALAAGTADTRGMRGVGARHPVVGLAFAIFILGLIGVPPTAGFLGKLLVFQAGMSTPEIGGVVLAILLAANSALSLGYYVPLLSNLMFQGHGTAHTAATAADGGVERLPKTTTASVVALAAVTILLGLFPQILFGWIEAARTLFPGGGP
ncbi:MAG TPA: proton-conducting transporter membrane subunit [Thermoplasmata archaeon]